MKTRRTRIMKFALNEPTDERIEPKVGLIGICPSCKGKVISKCGKINVYHWAHKIDFNCDTWWEPETIWHRDWKNKFPKHWQEIIKYQADNGEKHIADIYNPFKELVIEFQNSKINSDELFQREQFYGKMIWVLNGNKLKLEISSLYQLNSYNVEKLRKKIVAELIQKNVELRSEIRKQFDEFGYHNKENTQNMLNKISQMQSDVVENEKLIKEISRFNELKDFRKFFDLENYFKRKSRKTESIYLQYSWKYRSKIWRAATKPMFIDLGNELIFLKNDFIAMKVSYESFIKKYNEEI